MWPFGLHEQHALASEQSAHDCPGCAFWGFAISVLEFVQLCRTGSIPSLHADPVEVAALQGRTTLEALRTQWGVLDLWAARESLQSLTTVPPNNPRRQALQLKLPPFDLDRRPLSPALGSAL